MFLGYSVVDDKRSCSVTTTKNPTHIISEVESSSFNQEICGTKNHPWRIETPVGQKIIIILLKFVTEHLRDAHEETRNCRRQCGTIIDKAGRRNRSFCPNGSSREETLFPSTGNALDIILNSNSERDSIYSSSMLILKLEGGFILVKTCNTLYGNSYLNVSNGSTKCFSRRVQYRSI